MTVRNLDKLFKPASIALIGASRKPGTVGAVVARNLFQAGFDGPVMPVNPTERAVEGVLTYKTVDSLPITPDLGVICTAPNTVAATIDALGKRGTKAAIVMTNGMSAEQTQAMLETAKESSAAAGLRELLDLWRTYHFRASDKPDWSGTATALISALNSLEGTRELVAKVVPSHAWLGRNLRGLIQQGTDWVSSSSKGGNSIYTIKRPTE